MSSFGVTISVARMAGPPMKPEPGGPVLTQPNRIQFSVTTWTLQFGVRPLAVNSASFGSISTLKIL